VISSEPFPWAKYGPTLQWCRVCGTTVWFPGNPVHPGNLDAVRCEKHRRRNACAVDGCKRSTAAKGGWFGINLWLCHEHWRLIPPRSAERKVYNRMWRRVKKCGGWDKGNGPTSDCYWRVWKSIVSRVRARARGDLDMREINKIMGWEEKR
jgi:hypothetical protein